MARIPLSRSPHSCWIRVRAVVPAKGSRARTCRRAARSREARIRRCPRASVARGPPRTPGPRRSRRQASQTVPARNARVGRGTRRSAPARRVPSALGSLAPAPRRRPRPEGATATRRRRRMANAPSAAAARKAYSFLLSDVGRPALLREHGPARCGRPVRRRRRPSSCRRR